MVQHIKIDEHKTLCKKNEGKRKNRIISADGEKSCDKIQYPFMIKKKIQQTSSRKLPQHNKNNMWKTHSDDHKVSGEAPKAFPLRSVTRNKCPLLPHLFNHWKFQLEQLSKKKK